MAKRIFVGAMLCVLATSAASAGDRAAARTGEPLVGDIRRPLRHAESASGEFRLEVEPARAGGDSTGCTATLIETRGKRERWSRTLVNEVAPTYAAIRDDGKFIVTLDEYRFGGSRNTLVIYGEKGELLRHFLLPDLLARSDWKGITTEGKSIAWLRDARYEFVDQPPQFALHLSGNREIRIDLQKLRVVRASRVASVDDESVPTEVSTAIFGDDPDASEAETSAGEVATDTELLDDEMAMQVEEAGEEIDDYLKDRAELDEPLVPDQLASTAVLLDGPVGFRDSDAIASRELISVPQPDPSNPVNYVEWLNDMGHVDGPDANPLYQEAFALQKPIDVDPALWDRAVAGEPDAVSSPEIQNWLASDADAIEKFREAAALPAKSWNYSSDDGSMISVLLPTLGKFRELAKSAAIEGRSLELSGQGDEAADVYIDMLRSAAHTAAQPTLIEGLVGVAVQNLAAESVLDLAAGPSGENVDYERLAKRLEMDVQPIPDISRHLNIERAMFLDTAQSLWKPDASTGELSLDMNRLAQFSNVIGGDPLANIGMALKLSNAGFEQTVSDANQIYDAMVQTSRQPWTEAKSQMMAIEERIKDENTNPFVRIMTPALSRAVQVSQRSESQRRAAALVTNIMAYKQSTGDYPAALDVFDQKSFVVDPLSNQRFVYKRTADGFQLYSRGDNGIDDGGQHNPKWDESPDRVYWPRPPKK